MVKREVGWRIIGRRGVGDVGGAIMMRGSVRGGAEIAETDAEDFVFLCDLTLRLRVKYLRRNVAQGSCGSNFGLVRNQ